jgi:hypothetical protein
MDSSSSGNCVKNAARRVSVPKMEVRQLVMPAGRCQSRARPHAE